MPLHLVAAAAAAMQTVPSSAVGACSAIFATRLPETRRPVSEADLAGLRDIGGIFAAGSGERVFSVSPDGRRAALQVHRADAERNGYCLALVVVDLRPGAKPVVVDRGDELIRFRTTVDGRLDQPFGTARTITPRWSPDGRFLIYLKQHAGRVQAWLADARGGGARQLTSLREEVDDVRWGRTGQSVVLATRPDLPGRHAALSREGLTGHHYDERFMPMNRQAPFPRGPVPTVFSTLTLADGLVRPASAEEAALFASDVVPGLSPGTVAAVSPGGTVATLEPDAAGLAERRQRLRVRAAGGRMVECAATRCSSDIVSHWWSADGSRVEYLRREGDNREIAAFYDWRPGHSAPVGLLRASDLLFACTRAGRQVVCARETSTTPRHLALVDLKERRTVIAYDPNPEFERRLLGRVERIRMREAFGAPFFADLVYPVGYRAGAAYPLVVVQYESRGFLRGGTGDEYPIQVLAGRGFMVLSMNRPPLLAYSGRVRDPGDIDRLNNANFIYRRGVHSSLETSISALVGRGLVDPDRVGLTGLSEGSSAVQWALIHDRRFAATSMSGCCWGPGSAALVGLPRARDYRHAGHPSWADRDGDAFWREMSLVPHAKSIRTPMLVQTSDSELLEAVDAFTALDAAAAPIEMVVFPGELHVKWQPAHRLAAYERNVEWFAFWLQGRGSHADIPRWRALRERLKGRGQLPVPDWSRPLVRADQ